MYYFVFGSLVIHNSYCWQTNKSLVLWALDCKKLFTPNFLSQLSSWREITNEPEKEDKNCVNKIRVIVGCCLVELLYNLGGEHLKHVFHFIMIYMLVNWLIHYIQYATNRTRKVVEWDDSVPWCLETVFTLHYTCLSVSLTEKLFNDCALVYFPVALFFDKEKTCLECTDFL